MAHLKRLVCNGLRNLAPLDCRIDSEFLLITGNNGSGKTALLEGIALLASGRSFRENRLQRCQQWQAPQLTLYAEINNRSGHQQLGWQREKQQTQLRLNGETAPNQALLAQQLPVQVFSPESQDLLTQGPNERRRFIDWGAFYHEPSFLTAWRHYQHALKQRNHALRQQRPDREITLWHKPLLEAALQVHHTRKDYVHSLAETAAPLMAQVSDGLADISLAYQAGWDSEQDLLSLWQNQLAHDRQLGFTQAGPHRADLKLRWQDRDALSILSRGQQKLLALSLLLAQSQHLRQALNETPILLLDDLAAELDHEHQQRIFSLLPLLGAQTIFTATQSNQCIIPAMQHWQLVNGNLQTR
ncbi:MAG: DNA replication/repair protein RecF [Gammaproteobacteria bacterium]|nr:DNA replication/repair protein RecF [Gammaproteobacteria bacterium]